MQNGNLFVFLSYLAYQQHSPQDGIAPYDDLVDNTEDGVYFARNDAEGLLSILDNPNPIQI